MLFEPNGQERLWSSFTKPEGATCSACVISFNNILTLFWLSTLFLFTFSTLTRFCFMEDVKLFLDLRDFLAHCTLLHPPPPPHHCLWKCFGWLTDYVVRGSGFFVPMKLVTEGWTMIDMTSVKSVDKSFTPLLRSLVIELSQYCCPSQESKNRMQISHRIFI